MPLLNKLLIIVMLCLLHIGCARVVDIAHNPKSLDAALNVGYDNINYGSTTKVLIQPVNDSEIHLDEHLGLLIAGPQNRWVVNLNEALPHAIYAAAKKTYDNVQIGNKCSDCGLVFRPNIKRIGLGKLSMQAAVEIDIDVYDAYGIKVTQISAQGKSPFMDLARLSTGVAGYFIPFFGTVMGKNTVSATSRKAFNKAVSHFHEQIVEQTQSGVLARHYLPKRKNRNYKAGEHQFSAERVAIDAGCRIDSDEVRLVSKNFASESFVANCWGKSKLVIDCEYGRCALRQ